ncbi:MAG: penicillin acylase family protein, partial [Bacteroidales bacterium]|nr:penicillin acylase family protein [Bacteroidales bacterium]
SQNFAYADIDGNIGLNTGGGIPVRKEQGSVIRNGENDLFDWKGYVPFDQLPSSLNPVNGYTSSANNKTVADDYPYYISYKFYVPYRIDRIRQMLEEKDKFDTEDFKRMITDQNSAYAQLLLPHILRLTGRMDELSQDEKNAFNAFENWNCDMNKDLIAPSLFEFFSSALAKNLLGDELEDLYDDLPASLRDYYIYRILNYGPDKWVDDIKTSVVEDFDQIVFRSFREAVKEITSAYGSDTAGWRWGAIHKLVLEHPLGSVRLLDRIFKFNSPAFETGGSRHTVCPYSYQPGFRVDNGASERHIFNTADWDESLTVIPTGASGIPASEFYLSQSRRYVEGGFYKDAFSEKAVKETAKYRLVLNPGSQAEN